MLCSRDASYSLLSGPGGLIPGEHQVREEQEKPGYDAQNLDTPVVIISSEISPWSKTGGLAIVGASYAYEFAMRGHSRVMAISPMYDDYQNCTWVMDKEIVLWGTTHTVKYFHQYICFDEEKKLGTDYVFVHHDSFRRAGGLYHNAKEGKEYDDNLFRFALFSIAALEAPLCLHLGGTVYGEKCMFIANDWQAGLVPIYLVHKYRRHNTYNGARCMFVIHNMGYQGAYPFQEGKVMSLLGLPSEATQDVLFIYPHHMRCHQLDKGEVINLTKGGIVCCDRVCTVSKNYSLEIQTGEGGFMLDDLVRSKAFFLDGIQNGIDDNWNSVL
jgi:starch synthase